MLRARALGQGDGGGGTSSCSGFVCFVTGEPLATLEGHTDKVRSASFSPDGSRIVSSSDDRTVRVWNANSGMRRFGAHMADRASANRGCFGGVLCPRITRVSTECALRFAWGRVLWDRRMAVGDQQLFWFLCVVTGQPLATLEGHTEWVTSASFSPDGSRIVSSSFDLTVRVWNANSGMRFGAHMADRTACGFGVLRGGWAEAGEVIFGGGWPCSLLVLHSPHAGTGKWHPSSGALWTSISLSEEMGSGGLYQRVSLLLVQERTVMVCAETVGANEGAAGLAPTTRLPPPPGLNPTNPPCDHTFCLLSPLCPLPVQCGCVFVLREMRAVYSLLARSGVLCLAVQ